MLKSFISLVVIPMLLNISLNTCAVAGPPPPPPPPDAASSMERSSQNEPSDVAARQPSKAVREAPSRLLSGLGQVGGGLVGGTGLGLGGVLIGAAVCQSGNGWDDLGCALGLGIIGYMVGTPLGVWAVGEWIGWDGSLLATIGGTVVGLVVFGALASALNSASGGSSTTDAGSLFFVLTVPTAGAMGYHLFADWPTGSNASLAPKATMIQVIHFEF